MKHLAESSTSVRIRTYVVLGMGAIIIFVSGVAFVMKLIDLVIVLWGGPADTLFVITPFLNYVLATAGFMLMLFWAIGQGMFRNIERPKFRLLDDEEYLDRTDGESDDYEPEPWLANRQ